MSRPSVRQCVFTLTLLSQLLLAFGLPLPTRSDAALVYPCQQRPCGCGSAAECWQGDCCCFTLEEKLAWAEANGVEPPGHVRPLVAARRADAPASQARLCCSEARPNCPDCDDESPTHCCADKRAVARPALSWMIGLFARKCRGEASDRLAFAQPCLVPVSTPIGLDERVGSEPLCLRMPAFNPVPRSPAVPPPRSR